MEKRVDLSKITSRAYLPAVKKIFALRRNYFRRIQEKLAAIPQDHLKTLRHTQRVTNLLCLVAMERGLKGEQLFLFVAIGESHDIGKTRISPEVLNPEEFTEEQWLLMQRHPWDSYNYVISKKDELRVKEFGIDDILRIANPVLLHHEYQGKRSYPKIVNYKPRIPAEDKVNARILAIADVFDSHLFRCLSANEGPLSPEMARIQLQKQFNRPGDQEIIDLLFAKLPLIKKYAEAAASA